MTPMKKFLYFLLFLLLLSLAFFLYWYFSQKGYVPKIPFLPDNPFGITGQRNNPTRGGGNTGTSTPDRNTNGSTTVVFNEDKLFERVWKDPVAGYSFSDYVTYTNGTSSSDKKVSTTTALLFVDRGTGHIYKKTIFTATPPTKVSNTTVPGVYDAYFFNKNTEIVMRYLRESDNTIMTLYAKLPPLSSSLTLSLHDMKVLEQNIISVAVSPIGNLYYLVKTSSGSTLYLLKDGVSGKIHDYDLSELSLGFNGENLIVSQKPSAFEKTYFFTMNEDLLYGGRTGQKVLFSSKDKDTYLSSAWTNLGIQLFSNTLQNNKLHVFGIKTVADKCSSSNRGSYFFCFVPNVLPLIPFGLPDDWYKGLVAFNDSLYVIDTSYFEENKLSRLDEDTGEEMDVSKPVISSGDTYMAFSNRLTNELWAAKLGRLITR